MTATQARGEFGEGWKPLAACAVGIGLGLSPLPAFTAGVFAVELHRQFGWTRGAILGAQIFETIGLIVCGPLLGRLVDRIGARKVALLSTLAIGVTTAAAALATRQIWTFYLLTAVMAFTSIGTMPIVYAKVISLWFDRRRGAALGMALCTTGLAGIFLPIYVQTLINHFSWRWAYVGLGLLPLVISLPIQYFLLPHASGPKASLDHQGRSLRLEGAEIVHALRHYRFWLMALAALAVGISLGGLTFNLVPLMVDRGLTPTAAAKLFGFYGLAVVCGRLGVGWLLDRFWAPAVGCLFLLIPAAACFWLSTGVSQPLALGVIAVMLGTAGGAEFDLIAFLTARYFGRRNFGALYAGQYAMFGLGTGSAAGVFGLVHDAMGSYNPIALVAGALFGGAGVVLLALGPYPVLSAAEELAA